MDELKQETFPDEWFLPKTLELMCRACLSVNSQMHVLNILHFTECTSIMVSEYDGLPTQLCGKCANLIEQFYKFRQLCAYSEKVLRDNICLNNESPVQEIKNEDFEDSCHFDADAPSGGSDNSDIEKNEPNTVNNDEDGNLTTEEHSPVKRAYLDYSSESSQSSDTESRYSEEEFTYSDSDHVDATVDESVCDFIPKSAQTSTVSDPLSNISETNTGSLINFNHGYIVFRKSNDNITVNASSDTESSTLFSQNSAVLTKCKKKIDKKIIKRRVRLPDFCFYCKKNVQNFSRHVSRHHGIECEVQKILSTKKNSKKRKFLLAKLRKKGNYVQNCKECIKPVKRKQHSSTNDYLPCLECLGFYSRKQLWKHQKVCNNNADKFTQAEAQNVLIKNLKIDPILRELVFPRMRADRVSLVSKKDSLICAFGSQYLKIHNREKHFINVVSRKMRELGKLLLEMKNIEPSITDLSCALKPEYYDVIVNATKKCSKYDENEEKYLRPTFAMNISTSIKQCCNLAIKKTLKLQRGIETADVEANLKTLIQIIEADWKFDVSSQAADDLNVRKWNKITIVSLASDLKLLKDHLINTAKKSVSKLFEIENDVTAYIDLLETVYCRVLLLNRRRPGELKRLLLDTYASAESCENKHEEFDKVSSATEKILIKTLKCVVIRGKRGRGVPVLFSSDVHNDIMILNEVRDKYMEKNNLFLFAQPNCNTMVCGYKVMEKHAKLCGAKNPKAISSIRLKKHLATLTQIFNMSEKDIEQLANFMGFASGIHRKSNRLHDEISYTAKISKLLTLMEDGKADTYKGKSFDEIEVDLDDELVGDTIHIDELIEYGANKKNQIDAEPKLTPSNAPQPHQSLNPSRTVKSRQTVGKKIKKRNLVPWTPEQKNIVLQFFKTHIDICKPPKKHECETLKDRHPDLLSNKDWLKIKVLIQNTYSKK